MSDSTFLFSDPMDPVWEKDKLEPDELEVPPEIEEAVPEFHEDDLGRDESEVIKERSLRDNEEAWMDLALDDFIADAQREKSQQTQMNMSDVGGDKA